MLKQVLGLTGGLVYISVLVGRAPSENGSASDCDVYPLLATVPSVTPACGEDYTSDQLRELLMEEISGEALQPLRLRKLLCYAMEKQYVELREVGKTVVEHVVNVEEDYGATWYAMLAVRLFGESEQYFWAWFHGYRDMPRAAAYALLILASDGAEGLEDAVAEITQNWSTDQARRDEAVLLESVQIAREVLQLERQYRDSANAAERALLLLGHGTDGYSLGEGAAIYEHSGTGCIPRRWARHELYILGRKEPQVVADAFRVGPRGWPQIRDGYADASEDIWLQLEKELRDYIYPFLPEEVHALLDW